MKVWPAALTTAAVGALLLLGASPAFAGTSAPTGAPTGPGSAIDPGDSLYAITCNESLYPAWQLMSVDPSTAVSTTIGTGDGDWEGTACAFQPAYDVTTGTSYYIQVSEDNTRFDLATVDLATGVSTTIGQLGEQGEGTYYPPVQSMAIGLDGAAYLVADDGFLYSVDLATAELTVIGDIPHNLYAFAVDPSTGDFYAIDFENRLFLLDLTEASFDYVDDVRIPDDYYVYSMQIDESGQFWVEADNLAGQGSDAVIQATLWSFTLATIDSPVYSGIFTDDPYYTEALLLIPGAAPAPALPATGVDAGTTPLAAGVLVLLGVTALGVAIVVTRRRAA